MLNVQLKAKTGFFTKFKILPTNEYICIKRAAVFLNVLILMKMKTSYKIFVDQSR